MSKHYFLNALTSRIERLENMCDNFCTQGLSLQMASGFSRLINEGREIVNLVESGTKIGFAIQARIEMFLDTCNYIIGAVVYELQECYCEILEVIELFQVENQLILVFLNKEGN